MRQIDNHWKSYCKMRISKLSKQTILYTDSLQSRLMRVFNVLLFFVFLWIFITTEVFSARTKFYFASFVFFIQVQASWVLVPVSTELATERVQSRRANTRPTSFKQHQKRKVIIIISTCLRLLQNGLRQWTRTQVDFFGSIPVQDEHVRTSVEQCRAAKRQ